jgi:hypothetical protein
MKLKALATAVLATTAMGLSVARPGLSVPDLNAQLQQAVCSQNWIQAIQITEQMKKVVGSEYASQLTRYQGRLESLAREGTRVPTAQMSCSANVPTTSVASASTVPSNNVLAKTPTNTNPQSKGTVKVTRIKFCRDRYGRQMVEGEVSNNTNNPISHVKVAYKIVNEITNARGLASGEEITYSGTAVVKSAVTGSGTEGVFTTIGIPPTVRGKVKVLSVQWINNSDNSQQVLHNGNPGWVVSDYVCDAPQ